MMLPDPNSSSAITVCTHCGMSTAIPCQVPEQIHNCSNMLWVHSQDKVTEAEVGLPTDAKSRKEHPIFSGVLMYFPDAIAAVAHCSFVGNEQHNPGQPLNWNRELSTDELDALTRHLLEVGTTDVDGVRHSAKVAWRALANLQKEIERDRAMRELGTDTVFVSDVVGDISRLKVKNATKL